MTSCMLRAACSEYHARETARPAGCMPSQPSAGDFMMHCRCLFVLWAVGFASVLHAQTPLRVVSFPGGANLPLWVAEDTGLFARERLSVTVNLTPNSVALIRNLINDDEDVAIAANSPVSSA